MNASIIVFLIINAFDRILCTHKARRSNRHLLQGAKEKRLIGVSGKWIDKKTTDMQSY